jgi:hypothetical protein
MSSFETFLDGGFEKSDPSPLPDKSAAANE